ncbi:MAG: response regulator [Isosphaeraceae bacterium]|nr:response regulator [Isosphaeraceae bacterium]
MQAPLILVIDDNTTTRKVVEGHLAQAGYRVVLASDADRGIELAKSMQPDVILLDHQLPGITGDQVCRRLLDEEVCARIPVIVCSAMRGRAFARYAEFPNVVDQIPKPFTAELLKSGVANALHTGAMVIQAQLTGSTMPEQLGEGDEVSLQGFSAIFPLRAVIHFLTNGQHQGRLTVETGKDRLRFALASGRIQAVYSATVSPERLEAFLPPDLASLAPLLALTMSEQQDAQTSGLVKLLEKSLADPKKLRALLRFQSAVLTYWALTGEPGEFTFLTGGALPPMFQAFPLHLSLPALAVEGVRRCVPPGESASWGDVVFVARMAPGSNPDRTGLSTVAQKVLVALDGSHDLESIARDGALGLEDVAVLTRGLELAGMVERRVPGTAILVVDNDAETLRVVDEALTAERLCTDYKVARDRVGAQLLLRRGRFDIVLMDVDGPEQEKFYGELRAQAPARTRFVGFTKSQEEVDLIRLDTLGLDGIIERPATVEAITATLKHFVEVEKLTKVS